MRWQPARALQRNNAGERPATPRDDQLTFFSQDTVEMA